MNKIPILMPDFEEDSNEISTQIDIPNTNNYMIFTIRYMLDGFFSYQVDYHQINRDVITHKSTFLPAQYCLIPFPTYRLLIPYNIQCTTEHGQDPQGKYTFLQDTKFYLYSNDEYIKEMSAL